MIRVVLFLVLTFFAGCDCQKEYTTEQRRADMNGAVVPVVAVAEVEK